MGTILKQEPIRTVYSDGSVVISNIRDPYTNELTSFTVTNTWYDGTHMTDAKVDQYGIYTKYRPTGEYVRKNLPNWGVNFLEVDSVVQLRDLDPYYQYLIWIGYYKGTRVNGYWIKGDTKRPIEYIIDTSSNIDDGGSILEMGVLKLSHTFVGEVDIRYFGANGKKEQNCYPYCEKAWKYCITNRIDLLHPTGTYNVFGNNFPYKTLDVNGNYLYDCNYITIKGDGYGTILMTETPTGADVLNLHKVKNLNIRDLMIKCVLTGNSMYGTNGISLIGGYDNINIDNVKIDSLNGIQKGNYTQTTNKGNWNASTNTPSLLNASGGTVGDYYTVTVAGTQNFGSGTNHTFEVGDVVVYGTGGYWKQSYYVDGGKALTLQNGSSTLECGTLNANIEAVGCGYGFGIDYHTDNFANKKTSINVNIIAEKCHRALSIDGIFPSSKSTPSNILSNVNINCTAINCQEDIFGLNVLGCNIKMSIQTTESAEARRKTPDGSRYWNRTNREVNGVRLFNLMYSTIELYGNKGECDSKYKIGGATIPSSNTNYVGTTQNSFIKLNVVGAPITAFNLVNNSGNYIRNCTLMIMSENLETLPIELFTAARQNHIIAKNGDFNTQTNSSKFLIHPSNSRTPTGEVSSVSGYGVIVKQLVGSVGGTPVFATRSVGNKDKFRVLENGIIQLASTDDTVFSSLTVGPATPPDTIVAKTGDIYIKSGIFNGQRMDGELWFKRTNTDSDDGWVRIDTSEATETSLGLVKQAKTPSGTLSNVGATYSQTEVQAIVDRVKALEAALQTSKALTTP